MKQRGNKEERNTLVTHHARIPRKLISLPRSALLLTTISELPLLLLLLLLLFFFCFYFFPSSSSFSLFFPLLSSPTSLHVLHGRSFFAVALTVRSFPPFRRHVAPINYQLLGSVHRQSARSTTCSECTFNRPRTDSCRPQIETEESRLPTARHLSRLIKPSCTDIPGSFPGSNTRIHRSSAFLLVVRESRAYTSGRERGESSIRESFTRYRAKEGNYSTMHPR